MNKNENGNRDRLPLLLCVDMSKERDAVGTVDLIFICVCAVIILLIGVCVYAIPHDGFSEEENRALSGIPAFSADALFDCRFFAGLSSFYSDSVPLRKTMIRVKAVCELMLGKAQSGSVLFLKGGRLADRCEYEDLGLLRSNIERLGEYAAEGRFACRIIPRSVDAYADSEEAAFVRGVAYSGGLDDSGFYYRVRELARAGGEAYYKTDHHLSRDGVFLLYESIMEELGREAYSREDFKEMVVCSDFLGSAYSSSGLLPVSRDTVTIFRYEGDEDFCVKCLDEGCDLSSLYCFDALEGKDKYRVFTGGNHGVLRIEREGEDRERLVVVKDSFANAVIPLLARHFDLVVIDPRYTDEYDTEGAYATVVIVGIDTLATTRFFK